MMGVSNDTWRRGSSTYQTVTAIPCAGYLMHGIAWGHCAHQLSSYLIVLPVTPKCPHLDSSLQSYP